jgi:NAD(P)-dependent dehydrogenase (short-subunit alcohol dehydrogenase family)
MRFSNQTVVITGGSTGIGFATAHKFASEGASVVLLGRRVDKGKEAVEALRSYGTQALFVACDVAVESEVDEAIAEAIRTYGQIDVLVNNAAMFEPASLAHSSSQQWKSVFETIAYGAYYGTKAVASHMIERHIHGAIINVSSINAYRAMALSSHYNAAKGAMDQLTRCAAVEFAEFGIRVNAVNPGFIDTPMSIVDGENELESDWFQDIYVQRRKIAQARAGKPEEVAAVIAFLASDDASYICGATIPVDGGLSITF